MADTLRNNPIAPLQPSKPGGGTHMKVTKIDAFLIGAGRWNFTFVNIQTGSGLVDWGEGTPGWRLQASGFVSSFLERLHF
jgi:hypothetical protein